MRTSRRRFVRETTLVSSAIALGSALPAVSGQTSGQTSGQISGQANGQTSGQTSAQTSNQADAHIQVFPAEPIATIEDDVYGHFIEHLGGVIYDGVWVGENSKIANLHGIRTAFLDTMPRDQGAGAALAGWVLRRQLRLARRDRAACDATAARGVLEPAGYERVRPA